MEFKHLNGSFMSYSDSGYASGDEIIQPNHVGVNLIPNQSTPLKTPTPDILNETTFNEKRPDESTGFRPKFSPEIPVFSGKSDQSIILHVSKIEKLLTYYRIPQTDEVNVLGISLDGEALIYFDLINTAGVTFQALKHKLIERFNTEPIGISIWTTLHNRKQSYNETVREFFHDIFNKSSKLKLGNETIRYIFLYGLKTDIRRYVLLQNPLSLDESFRLAKWFESVQLLDQFETRNGPMTPTEEVHMVPPNSNLNQEYDTLVGMRHEQPPPPPISNAYFPAFTTSPNTRFAATYTGNKNSGYHRYNQNKKPYRTSHRKRTQVKKWQATCNGLKLQRPEEPGEKASAIKTFSQPKLNSANTRKHTLVTATPARVDRKTTLPPNSTRKIALYPKDNILAKTIKFQGKSEFLQPKGLHMESTVLSGLTGNMQCAITNTTGRPVTLYPDKQVGSFTIVREPKECMLQVKTTSPPIQPNIEITRPHINSSRLTRNVEKQKQSVQYVGANNQHPVIHSPSQIEMERKNHRLKVLSEITNYFRIDRANKART